MQFLPEWTSDLGLVATLLGLAFTIWQILRIGSTTKKIQAEVKATQTKIQKVLAISDLSKSSETIKIIFNYLKEGNYELAHSKITEINDTIIEIKEVPSLRRFEDIKTLESYGRYLANDLKKLQDIIICERKDVDHNILMSISDNLRAISDTFARINAQLKHNNDD